MNDREPDPPHTHLGGDGWRESSRPYRPAGRARSCPESWVAQSWRRCLIEMKGVGTAWQREGTASNLGEREPYDNPATTHGICSRHQEQALEALPSQSFPDAEMLIVVRPNDTELYHYLLRR